MIRHREAERPESFTFGTKAETLMRLVPLIRSAAIPDLCFFTVEQWHAGREAARPDPTFWRCAPCDPQQRIDRGWRQDIQRRGVPQPAEGPQG
jgi:hypothetical protein